MFIRFHKFVKDEDGQAIVLAAVGMLVMALSVLMTAFWGYAVYEKIKLQNNADSTAYSLAVMEARVLNYIAYLNRAMIANYVRLIAMQSLISYVTWLEAVSARVHDILYNTIYGFPCQGCLCTCIKACAGICCNSGLVAASMPFATLTNVFGQILNTLDNLWPTLKNAVNIANNAFSNAQAILVNLIYVSFLDAQRKLIEKNDPEINLSLLSVISPLINSVIWMKALKKAESSDKRMFSSIVNATRWNDKQTNRKDIVPVGGAQFSGGGVGVLNKEGQTKLIDSLSKNIISSNFQGESQAKNEIEGIMYQRSVFPDGAVLASFDKTSSPLMDGMCNTNSVEVFVLDADKGAHKRLSTFFQKATYCGGCSMPIPANLDGQSFLRKTKIEVDNTDMKHNNFVKIPNFYVFNIDENPDTYFGQPIVFTFLNKPPERFKMKPVYRKSTIMGDNYSANIDTRMGEKGVLTSGLLRGLNAMSLAQVYYHRPYTWKEHPNLFNPYWRARLIAFGERDGKLLPAWLSRATGINFPNDILGIITKGLVLH
ncbi:MAG: Tad domain-containing protein [Deltaproteobacteria bacterium]|nr:Tad domain-containing protein [Deltaproteobacteria bacterium]